MVKSKTALAVCLVVAAMFPALAVEGLPDDQPQNEAEEAFLGTWDMETEFQGQQMLAVMTISMEDGELAGVWASQGMEMVMTNIVVDGDNLTFQRTMGDGGMVMDFDGTVDGDTITGKWITGMGELPCAGNRRE